MEPTLRDILETALNDPDDFIEYQRLVTSYKRCVNKDLEVYIDSVIRNNAYKVETIKLLRSLVPEFSLAQAKRFYEMRYSRFEAINKAQTAINKAEEAMTKALAQL